MVAPFDHVFELLAGKEDPALHGAEREMKHIRDFLVFVTQVMHLKRYTKRFIEAFHHRRELVHHNVGLRAVVDGGAAAIDIVEIIGRINDRPGLDVFPVVIDEDILHNRQQPCFQVGAGDKLIHVADRPEGGFLIEVLRFFAVFGQFVSECVEGAAET